MSLTLDPQGAGAHTGTSGTDSTVRPQNLNCGVVRPSGEGGAMLQGFREQPSSCRVWWGVPEIQTLRRMRYGGCQFQAILATQ